MRRRPGILVSVGGVIVGLLAAVAVFAGLLSPFDPRAAAGPSLAAPSSHHLLGTNDAGQDILSQLIWGARSSAVVALLSAALSVGVGVLVGTTAGLRGGWTDVAVMRVVDAFLAVPALPLLILIAALAGPSRTTVILVIALAAWPSIARVLRSQTLSLRRRGYVDVARGLGAAPLYVIRRHLVPAVGPIIAANFVYWAGTAVVLQAGLGVLGLNDPTEVSWGSVLNRALGHPGIYLTSEWTWWVLPAGLVITVAALGLALLGLALEPRSNPRLQAA